MIPLVVLVPGVGFGGMEMLPLARRLERRGYATRVFRHQPWQRHPGESARALHRMVSALDAEVVHFVGHSMGGVVSLRMMTELAWHRPGRVVTLASPHRGFTAVRRVAALPGGRWIAGRGPLAVRDPGGSRVP